ncbi:MAG: hypothetical protein KDH96_02520 [Candidatus Riesia sp.]|nr:hypothetical protein [Candidatus Riesia sp.]
MGLSAPQDVYFVTLDGNVKSSGGTSTLANGQVAIVNMSKSPTVDGAVIVSDFSRVSKRDKMEIRMGKPKVGVSRSLDNKSWSSLTFTLEDVEEVRVDAPTQTGIKVDDFIIGYNGVDGSEIVLDNGDNEVIQLMIKGKAMSYLGYKDGCATVQFQIEAPNQGSFTMQEIIEKAVERLEDYDMLGQVKLTEFVDIIPVNSENPASIPNAITQQFYNLTLEDDGTYTALGRVQAQYNQAVVRTSFDGNNSVYTMVASSLPSAYSESLAQVIKGCDDCPDGYDELEAGFITQISVEDDGADISATIEANVPGVVASSTVKNLQDNGVGYYTFVTDDPLTDSEITTFLAVSNTLGTAKFTEIGDVVAVCENTDTTDTAWVAGEACSAIEEVYTITLADDECGQNRLAELQDAYPELTIYLAGTYSNTVTLTGTSGTANVVVNGTNYLATFNSSLTTTATDFVTAHGATLSALGITVTANAGVLTFTTASESQPTLSVANVSGDLAGTVGTPAPATTTANACQTTYVTRVLSNVICDECDDEFRALFYTSAPVDFDLVPWTKEAKTYSETAKMGIRFRAKPTILAGAEWFRDDMPFIAEAPRLSLVGGFPDRVNESYNFGTNGRFTVKLLSRYNSPKNYGGNLRNFEDMSRMYFDNNHRHVGNNYGKYVFGEETKLEATKQYVDYALTIHRRRYTQGWSDKVDEGRTYHFIAEVGRHQAIEDMLNGLALAAGVPTVQAYAE